MERYKSDRNSKQFDFGFMPSVNLSRKSYTSQKSFKLHFT